MRKVLSVEFRTGVRPPMSNMGLGHPLQFFSWRGLHGGEPAERPGVRVWELANGDILLMSHDDHAIEVPRANVTFIEPWEQGEEATRARASAEEALTKPKK